MGLFSRLTARIHAKSRRQGSVIAGSPGYPYKSYEELRTSVEEAIMGHGLLTGQIEAQIPGLEGCILELNAKARKSVGERNDRLASSALYLKILISRELGALHSRIDSLETERVKLKSLLEALRIKVHTFSENEKEFLADFSPVDARSRISESTAGLDEELETVRFAVVRALENSAMARKCCQESKRLIENCSTNCTTLSPDLTISDEDRESVNRALMSLQSEVNQG